MIYCFSKACMARLVSVMGGRYMMLNRKSPKNTGYFVPSSFKELIKLMVSSAKKSCSKRFTCTSTLMLETSGALLSRQANNEIASKRASPDFFMKRIWNTNLHECGTRINTNDNHCVQCPPFVLIRVPHSCPFVSHIRVNL